MNRAIFAFLMFTKIGGNGRAWFDKPHFQTFCVTVELSEPTTTSLN